ncbi:hypothetical protein ACFQ0M_16415 [Kitasatospora aburaviensis]
MQLLLPGRELERARVVGQRFDDGGQHRAPTADAALTWIFQPSPASSPAVGLAVHQKPSTVTSQSPPPPRLPAPARADRATSGHAPTARGA